MADIQVVFAIDTTSLRLGDGSTVVVHKGSHWPTVDPVVRQFPASFSTDPRYGLSWTGEAPGYMALPPDMPLVDSQPEAATAGPGERRVVRRG